MFTDEHLLGIIAHHQSMRIQVGYEDMANPFRVGTVSEHRAGQFRVTWDDEEGGETWSDLKQAGWKAIFRP